MRLKLPKIREMLKKKGRITETDAKVLDRINRDKVVVDKMVKLLNESVEHPRYPHHEEVVLAEIERKAIKAKIYKDRFSQVYYEDMAKKLGNAILKNLGKWHVRDNYRYEKHPHTKLEKY